MTTEHTDTSEPKVEVEELRDLDLSPDEADDLRGGNCQGPAGVLNRDGFVQSK
jgi:hypothetical protein